jgi:hypothetical protein
MSRIFFNYIALMLCICCASTSAQLLPDNKNLNAQSVARWMQTNRDIAPIVQVVDSMNATDAALKAFEALPPAEQDQKINTLLKSNDLLESANQITQQYGWKSVGEYMRLSTKLGNAIAAYFLFGDLGKVTEEQEKQLKEKADPAVLAVPKSDIDFIKKNEKALQKYIQAYGAGR